jgi:hypothetical protein
LNNRPKREKEPIHSRADPAKDVPKSAAVTLGNGLRQNIVVVVVVIPVYSLSITE